MLDEIAIVLTAHPKQQKWWAPVLLSLEGYPGPLILAYDDIDLAPIPADILERFTSSRATAFPAGELGHGRGDLLCMLIGFDAAWRLGARYCLKLGFDEPPWRWRNLARLADELEDDGVDCIDSETRVIFGITRKILDIMGLHDVVHRGAGSAESYWRAATKELGLKRRYHENRDWWESKLGLLHLQGEYAANMGKPNKWSWQIGELWPREGSADAR